jgi:hypothetical protein
LATVRPFVPMTLDLSYKVISSERCSRSFITSDHPVILYNSFLEERKTFGGNCGLASKGLQMFLPLSPKRLMMLYDGGCYAVGTRGNRVVPANDDDVVTLNALQYISCDCNLYLKPCAEADIPLLKSRHSMRRGKDSTVTKEFPQDRVEADGTRTSLMMNHDRDIKIGLSLSFMRVTKPGRRWVPPPHMGWTRYPVPTAAEQMDLGPPLGKRYVISSTGQTVYVS